MGPSEPGTLPLLAQGVGGGLWPWRGRPQVGSKSWRRVTWGGPAAEAGPAAPWKGSPAGNSRCLVTARPGRETDWQPRRRGEEAEIPWPALPPPPDGSQRARLPRTDGGLLSVLQRFLHISPDNKSEFTASFPLKARIPVQTRPSPTPLPAVMSRADQYPTLSVLSPPHPRALPVLGALPGAGQAWASLSFLCFGWWGVYCPEMPVLHLAWLGWPCTCLQSSWAHPRNG